MTEAGDVMLSVLIKVNAPTAVGSSALLGHTAPPLLGKPPRKTTDVHALCEAAFVNRNLVAASK
jgi:hypothetical protein